jgi:SAM-dependent methyltransferase
MIQRAAASLLGGIRRVRRIFTRLDREIIASTYVKGTGIEIGGLHNPLRVPRGATVKYVDRMTVAGLREQYPELGKKKLAHVDIIADGERLEVIADGTQDFVIANHFLEHCENPILALSNMIRVLRPGGIVYLAIPDKRFTFDSGRDATPFDHCLRDYREGPGWSHDQHFREWVTSVEKERDPSRADSRVRALLAMNYSIHYHVWTQTGMLAFLIGVKAEAGIVFELEAFLQNAEEAIFVLSKPREAS